MGWIWKLRNKKMGIKLKKSRMARVERFRHWKREKKALMISLGVSGRVRVEESRGYGLCGWGAGWFNDSGRCCLLPAWGQCRWRTLPSAGESGWVGITDWRDGEKEWAFIPECQVEWKGLSVRTNFKPREAGVYQASLFSYPLTASRETENSSRMCW